MKQHFQGWDAVGLELESLAEAEGTPLWPLNGGQCASLRAIKSRLPSNGVVIADEVGMGKTRIAVALARSVINAGGRVAILVPPGLGFQWRDELRDGGVQAPEMLRSLLQYFAAWSQPSPRWFEQDVVLVSHAFSNWRLGENTEPWRWGLLPTLYARWRKCLEKRYPRGFVDNKQLGDVEVQAAAKSIAEAVHELPASNLARTILEQLSESTPWPRSMEATEYRRNQGLRPSLEQAVGLGLGVFDLVIIDEAHKSRGDDSGLSRMLDRVVLMGKSARRLAMTATPVELDISQWRQTLERIGVDQSSLSDVNGDVFSRYAAACMKVRQCPNDEESRKAYRNASMQFQTALSPYLLRRDKREVPSVKKYAELADVAVNPYRQELEIAIETSMESPAWRQAVCAAEALSITSRQADDPVSKRLRLTFGNGHGIAALLDQAKLDPDKDKQQIELERRVAVEEASLEKLSSKRLQRMVWWRQLICDVFAGDEDPLYEHPAIRAAADAVETVARSGEKVLVFGRFTLPLQALVALLNAREMLRTLDLNKPWPQAKVHDDEWQAIQAAHRHLKRPGKLIREELDTRLARQYRELEDSRSESRSGLIELLDAGLPAEGRARQVFEAFKVSVEQHTNKGDSPLILLTKVVYEVAGLERHEATAKHMAEVFSDIIEAASERGEGDENRDGILDKAEAANLWKVLQVRLREEFNRPEGGFARLMYGATKPDTRRLLQLAFNRPNSNPQVLVAQSVVGREGLNLHRACKTVILLHPEWNPGVVEQQIGRVDRVGSLWERQLDARFESNDPTADLPRILIRPVVFKGTYDERNWQILQERWGELRAQLHGVVISARMGEDAGLATTLVEQINAYAPVFHPNRLLRLT